MQISHSSHKLSQKDIFHEILIYKNTPVHQERQTVSIFFLSFPFHLLVKPYSYSFFLYME